MKKLIVAIVAMVCAVASVMAQDIANIPDNSLYMLDCTAKPGEQITISVHMKNTATVQSLGMHCVMSEGLSMAKDEDGYYVIALSDRANKHNLFEPTFVKGEYRIAILQSGRPFKGNEGEIFTFGVKVADDITPGEYEVKLTEVELSGDSKLYDKGIISQDGVYAAKITVIDPTGINGVATDATDGAVEIYNVNGVKQSTLQPGLNIVKNVKTGEVKTVSVK